MPEIPNEHPTLWIKSTRSESLKGRTIVLAVTGSIAAVRTVELARELIRRGADVHAVMSKAAEDIISPMALHYATGNEVITGITGRVEHVEFFGNLGRADMLLIAPATANTIGKVAAGIDDTTVTTFATTAIGSGKPVAIGPAMHEDMYDHPAVADNIAKIKDWGIKFIGPRIEEGIAKIAPNEEIVLEIERMLGGYALEGKRILITSGATAESIDPIRIMTNRASGRTGTELALEAYRRGAEVTIVHRNVLGMGNIRDVFAESAQQMTDTVLSELESGYDILISAAAISDYTLDSASSKIKSGKELTLTFKPTHKLIGKVRKEYPEMKMVGFKAEAGASGIELIERARQTLKNAKLDMIVANEVSEQGMGTPDNNVHVIRAGTEEITDISGPKHKIAIELLDHIIEMLPGEKN